MKRSVFLKIITCISAFYGVILSLLTARREGYAPPLIRLLYFTAQSNLLLGVSKLLDLIFTRKPRAKRGLYVFSFICTVALTLTGITFCLFLAPLSPKDYTPWTVCNLFTHVITPFLGIMDFFTNPHALRLSKKTIGLCLLPPSVYCLIISPLSLRGVNFGRGVPYPYFFFHYRSPAGVWGFSHVAPFYVGSGYFLVLLGIFTLAVAIIFRAINNKKNAV